jgi:hypothetical protein
MTCETAVQEILTEAAAITALCPATRIRTPGAWQNMDRPYIVHFPVSIEPIRTHEGLQDLTIWAYYQVSIFSDSYSTGKALADAVIAALDGQHLVSSPAQGLDVQFQPGTFYLGWDDMSAVHHFALNFRIAEALV